MIVSTMSTSVSISDANIVSKCIMKSKGFNSSFEATCGDFCRRNSLKESLSEDHVGKNFSLWNVLI